MSVHKERGRNGASATGSRIDDAISNIMDFSIPVLGRFRNKVERLLLAAMTSFHDHPPGQTLSDNALAEGWSFTTSR